MWVLSRTKCTWWLVGHEIVGCWPAWFIGNVETCWNYLNLFETVGTHNWNSYSRTSSMGWELGAFFMARMGSTWYSHLAMGNPLHLMNFPLNRGAPTYGMGETVLSCLVIQPYSRIFKGCSVLRATLLRGFVFFKPLAGIAPNSVL
jgi:hypothetical protein